MAPKQHAVVVIWHAVSNGVAGLFATAKTVNVVQLATFSLRNACDRIRCYCK